MKAMEEYNKTGEGSSEAIEAQYQRIGEIVAPVIAEGVFKSLNDRMNGQEGGTTGSGGFNINSALKFLGGTDAEKGQAVKDGLKWD